MWTLIEKLQSRAFAPRPLIRLEVIRIFAPLAILGFLSSRMLHAEDWLSTAGFRVPALPDDWRQPVSLPGIPVWAAWAVCAVLVIAGLSVAVGFATRWAAGLFALALAYVALADRLAAFTVSKLAPVIALALCLTPSGTSYSISSWLRRRREPQWRPPAEVSGGCVLFFQVLLPVFYFSSGICKATGDWLTDPYVLWSHIHDSYQTPVSWFVGNHLPKTAWTVLQAATLVFECGAPLWFALRYTRPYALYFGVAMHLMIGLMFGPVIWFSLLMIVLLVGGYMPVGWLRQARGS